MLPVNLLDPNSVSLVNPMSCSPTHESIAFNWSFCHLIHLIHGLCLNFVQSHTKSPVKQGCLFKPSIILLLTLILWLFDTVNFCVQYIISALPFLYYPNVLASTLGSCTKYTRININANNITSGSSMPTFYIDYLCHRNKVLLHTKCWFSAWNVNINMYNVQQYFSWSAVNKISSIFRLRISDVQILPCHIKRWTMSRPRF